MYSHLKKSEEEMKIADEGYSLLTSTRAEFNKNFDKSDVEYGKLCEELHGYSNLKFWRNFSN